MCLCVFNGCLSCAAYKNLCTYSGNGPISASNGCLSCSANLFVIVCDALSLGLPKSVLQVVCLILGFHPDIRFSL